MAASFRSAGAWSFTANNVANPFTCTPGAPAGVAVGDLLVLVCESRSITATVATPSGWTLVTGFPKRSATASGGTIYVFVRIADGTASDTPSPVWTGQTTGTTGDASGAGILAWSGVAAVLDGTVASSDLTGQTITTVIPAFTTGTAGSLVIGIAMKLLESSGQTSTVATFTERADNSTTSGTGHIIEVSEKIQAAAGSSGTATVTWSATGSARALAVSLGLQAAPVLIAPDTGISATSSVSGDIAARRPITPDTGISATATVSGGVIKPGVIASADYETGTPGSNLSTADAGSATAFNGTTVTAPNTLTYVSGGIAAAGSISARHNLAGGANCYWRWTTAFGTQTQFYIRGYFRFPSNPATTLTEQIFWGLSGVTNGWRIALVVGTGGGLVRIYQGTTLFATGVVNINAGDAFRIEAFVDHPNGALTCRIFVGTNVEGTTPDETLSYTGQAMGGTTNTNDFRIGSGGGGTFSFDSDAIVAATGNWIGPVATTGGTKAITPTAISATATVSGAVTVTRRISGAISATATVLGSVGRIRPITPVAISASAIVSGSVRAIHRISGAIAATSSVSGAVGRLKPLAPTAISATSTVTGSIGRVRRIIPAAISATSTVTGGVVRLARITGAVSATSTVSGAVRAIHRVAGAITATSTVSGTVSRLRAIVPAVISATSTVSGAIARVRPIAPAVISATATVLGAVRVIRRISGAISATSTVSGSLRIGGKISGAIVSATSTVSGAVVVRRRITGAITATSTVSGAIGRIRRVSGAINATSTVSGTVVRLRPVSGVILATSSVSGIITARRLVTGVISAFSTVSASIGRIVYPTGAISATSTVSGRVSLLLEIVPAGINAISTVSGSIAAVAPSSVGGNIFATSTVTGSLRVGRIVYGREIPRLTAGRYETPDLTSTSYDKPVLERA